MDAKLLFDLERHAALIGRAMLQGEVARTHRILEGVGTVKFLVDTKQGGTFIARFYPRKDVSIVDYEPDLLRRMKSAGLPVANVVGDSRTGPKAPLPYMLYEMIPGTSLTRVLPNLSADARSALARQVVRFLKSLEHLSFSGYGEPVTGSSARFESWLDFVESSFEEGIEAARRHKTVPEDVIGDTEFIRRQLRQFAVETPHGLAWGDILPGNIIVDDAGQLAGCVDFEGSLAAEGLLGLGYYYASSGPGGFFQDLRAAWGGSGSPEKRDRVDLYSVLRGIRIAKFAHKPLPNGQPRERITTVFPGFGRAAHDLSRRLRDSTASPAKNRTVL